MILKWLNKPVIEAIHVRMLLLGLVVVERKWSFSDMVCCHPVIIFFSSGSVVLFRRLRSANLMLVTSMWKDNKAVCANGLICPTCWNGTWFTVCGACIPVGVVEPKVERRLAQKSACCSDPNGPVAAGPERSVGPDPPMVLAEKA